MIAAIPLLILPFILYNLGMMGILGSSGVAVFEDAVMSMTMLSGAVWTMSVGDLLIVIALALLFVEILKATRISSKALMDHLLVDGPVHRLPGGIPAGRQCRKPRLLHPDDDQLHRRHRRLLRVDAHGRAGRLYRTLMGF